MAGIVLAIVFLSVFWGVLARYVAHEPAAWSNELATIGFAWVVFLGAAAAAKKNLHLGIGLIVNLLPARIRCALHILMHLGLALLMLYIGWLAVKIGVDSLDRPTPVLRLPYTIVHAAVALGSVSIGVTALRNGFSAIRPHS